MERATGVGRRDGLGAAVIAGLLLYPQALARHAEALARARIADPEQARVLGAMLEHLDHGEALETSALVTTLAAKGLTSPSDESFAGIPYPFARSGADAQSALASLDSAVVMLVEGPELEAAIEAATQRFDFEEQSRLRQRKQELENRLKAQNRS
jgi:DNA primase